MTRQMKLLRLSTALLGVSAVACDNADSTGPSRDFQPTAARQTAKPIQYKSLSPGTQSVCGLGRNGEAFCWGLNNYGQLGDGTADYNTVRPRRVAGNLQFSEIAFGYQHGCGISRGSMYCWGHNDFGQIGQPLSVSVSRVPLAVNGGEAITYSAVAVGFFHTCAIGDGGLSSTTGSSIGFCWGSNTYGQLGNNEIGTVETTPQQVFHVSQDLVILSKFYPLKLYWLETSGLGTCALSEGTDQFGRPTGMPEYVACWGLNNGFVFGSSFPAASLYPYPTLSSLDASTLQLSLFNAGACAIDSNGSWCWGGTSQGETGDGTTAYRLDPVHVSDVSFIRISSGSSHSCGITGGGDAYCWGANHRGQLGTGNTTQSLVPARVAGGIKFKEIYAAGANPFVAFTCGITGQGEAYCWGANEVGELGDGTSFDRLVPTRVIEPI